MELNKENRYLLNKLLEVKETNMNVADILLYVYQDEIHPSKKEIQEIMNNENIDETKALFLWLMDKLEMNLEDKENLKLCTTYFLNNIRKEDIAKYIENPYVKAVSSINIKDKNYSLEMLSYEPYQLFPLNDLSVAEKDYYRENTPLGYFTKKYSFISLLRNNTIWMSLNPNEINTMKEHEKKAKGNILVLGLGLGYFPFICSLKNEVKSITIIEKDKEIMHLFNTYLFKSFPHPEKIKIIEADAIDYVSKNHSYDYIFADLWHNPIDGINLWYDLKLLERKFNLNISYWINNSFYALERRIALTLIENLNDKNLNKYEEFKLYPKVSCALLNEIKNTDNPIDILSFNNLKLI